MPLCSAPFISWTDSCTRSYVEALPPFIAAVLAALFLIPLPSSPTSRALAAPFKPYLTIPEAEALVLDDPNTNERVAVKPRPPLWRTVCLSGLAMAELIAWVTLASYQLVATHGEFTYSTTTDIIRAISWLSAVLLPIFRPMATAPYDLFAMYLFQASSRLFHFSTVWYDFQTTSVHPSFLGFAGHGVDLVVVTFLLVVVLRMPIDLPGSEIIAEQVVSRTLCSQYG